MNPNNVNNFFGIKVSKEGIPVQNASDKQLIYKDDFSTKTYYDITNSRMVEGLLPDGTYGMWVSKPGYDVTSSSAATNNQLVFNSNQDILKVGITGTYTWPSVGTIAANSYLPSSTTWYTDKIAHGLGITPIIACYIELPVTAYNPWGVSVYVPWNNADTASNVPYNHVTYDNSNGVGYTLFAGVDSTYAYFAERIQNGNQTTAFSTISQTFTYYVYANSSTT